MTCEAASTFAVLADVQHHQAHQVGANNRLCLWVDSMLRSPPVAALSSPVFNIIKLIK
jgi:hypothetical protein